MEIKEKFESDKNSAKETKSKEKPETKVILKNLLKQLKHPKTLRNWLIASSISAAVYSFFYGLYIIPFVNIGFYKMEQSGFIDYTYILLASLLTGLIVTLFLDARRKINKKGQGILAGGFAGALFGAVCPACLGINFLILGNVIAMPLPFLVPFIRGVQVLSLGLLSFGVFFISKSTLCTDCVIPERRKKEEMFFGGAPTPRHRQFMIIALIAVSVLLIYQLSTVAALNGIGQLPSSAGGINLDTITNEVLPQEGFQLDATWGNSVTKMIDEGVLDTDKLRNILEKRYGQQMQPEWEAILAGEDSKLEINADNSVFMMYLLWTFAKHNENPLLSNSPFAKYFTNYDIGVGRKGYGDVKLLELTPEQQKIAEKVALNSYRPCCGNPTGNPDCSHGYSALGLVEIMASQGFNEEEIFDAFVKFNSFWFPATYIQNAAYFKLTEEKDWAEVDKELVAGKQFSSLQGSYAVKKYLQDAGV